MRFPAQIEFLSQVPCLAVIVEPETIASRPQTTPAGLAFLRSQFLRAQAVGEQERIFAFTGLGSQDGTQELVAELAALLAKAEKRTLVVDLNFRDSTMPQLLGIQPHGKGLADWLWSEDPIQDYIHYSAIRELALLPTGQLKGDVDDLLSRRALAPDLKTLESEWDFILISAPSLLKVWYVLQAAPPEAHLIGVARYAEATLDDVIELQNRCIQSHLTLAGVVLHHFPKKHLKKEQMLWEFGPHRYLFDEV
jgi:Mrp family chromosome partitioning ATPase